jgi:hypothetical protein
MPSIGDIIQDGRRGGRLISTAGAVERHVTERWAGAGQLELGAAAASAAISSWTFDPLLDRLTAAAVTIG